MKKQAMNLVAALGFLLAVSATSAFAQTMKADIPFAFHAANETLPAGRYEVSTANTVKGSIIVRGTENKQAVAALVINVASKRTPEVSKLIFRRYGDQYFLAQIFVKGQTSGIEMLQTKAERRLLKQQRDHLARNVEPELVTIVAGQ